MTDQLSMWTVYERPADHPQQYVARRWIAIPKAEPTSEFLVADDLESLRQKLPTGLVRMDRNPGDDPVIVETWI
ncbi:hypothetical protein [Stutzerimonas stutzeri]|uniref:hypothetical protein n=1 Tax=Stutzerimonas stutzeri TaxID=316 RepID=UPI0015E34874|nr:hypothetical protein [Stutzerimonas stutzeri]MBA1280438.1 hypothetical protein [Stutzerimonas stutzeri]